MNSQYLLLNMGLYFACKVVHLPSTKRSNLGAMASSPYPSDG